MVEAYPYLPLRNDLRLTVAVFSYNHQLFFGLTGDYDTSDDIDVFADGIEEGIAELLEAADAAEQTGSPSPA